MRVDERERKKRTYAQGKREKETGKAMKKKKISVIKVNNGYCRSNAIEAQRTGIMIYRMNGMREIRKKEKWFREGENGNKRNRMWKNRK